MNHKRNHLGACGCIESRGFFVSLLEDVWVVRLGSVVRRLSYGGSECVMVVEGFRL